jgi:hypothetical protein
VTGVPSFFNILLYDILLLSLVANLPPVPTTLVVNENLRKDMTTSVTTPVANLLLVSLTLVANFPPVSLIPVP